MRLIAAISASLLLSACAASPSGVPGAPPAQTPPPQSAPVPPSAPPPPPVAGFRLPEIMSGPGLSGVIEVDGDTLIRQFGPARLDVREGDMRKLQFAGPPCVMDIFLYPLRPDAEPVATWIETRRASDGAEVDRLACIQALRLPGR